MITYYGRSYEPCHITKPKTYTIDKFNFLSIIVNDLILWIRDVVLEMADSFSLIMMVN